MTGGLTARLLDRGRRYYYRQLSPSALLNRGIDARWRRNPEFLEPRLTWPVDELTARTVTVHWPSTYPNDMAALLCDPYLRGLQRLVPVVREPLTPAAFGHLSFRVTVNGRDYPLSLVYSDYCELPDDTSRENALVFKMQYRRGGYGADNVLPAGYVSGNPALLDFLPRLRRMPHEPKYDVLARYSPDFAPEVRAEAVHLLEQQHRFRFRGGLSLVGYGQFLRECVRSKICIDLPGQGDFCTRLPDLLAVGACIVAWPHRTSMPVPLVDGGQLVHCRADLSDLVDTCAELLHDDARRAGLRAAARDYYDRFLHPDQLAAHMIHDITNRLA